MFKITIYQDGIKRTVNAENNTLISDLLDLNDIQIDYPCAKKGICRKCLVKVKGAIPAPTNEEIKLGDKLQSGYRLACCSRIVGDCEIFVDINDDEIVTAENQLDINLLKKDTLYSKNAIAVDIGTTTLALQLITENGQVFTKSTKNPQTEFGADVISRIERQLAGEGEDLFNAVVKGINDLIEDVTHIANIKSCEIDCAVITGNTVMMHLLTKHDCKPLSAAPFIAEYLGGEFVEVENLKINISEKASIYIPNCFSAFVGADISTAILASGMMNSQETSVLVDIGTNGEMALWHENKLYCCSTAAGPAFEGLGIREGMHGTEGAIDHLEFKDSQFEISVIGNGKAKGICGSGVIDTVAVMLDSEVLDDTGRIDDENEEYEDRIIDTDDDTKFVLKDDVSIYGKDIRAVQLAKSAICSGIETLINECNLTCDDIDTLYVAGGFGSFLNIEKAGRIGLIPEELVSKVKVIGNAALLGANLVLLDKNNINVLAKITNEFSLVDLASSKYFNNKYVENMYFE